MILLKLTYTTLKPFLLNIPRICVRFQLKNRLVEILNAFQERVCNRFPLNFHLRVVLHRFLDCISGTGTSSTQVFWLDSFAWCTCTYLFWKCRIGLINMLKRFFCGDQLKEICALIGLLFCC